MNIKNIILLLSIGILALSILFTVINQKYEIAVALAGIYSAIFIPFFTKNLELAKHRQSLYLTYKHEEYNKIYKMINCYIFELRKYVAKIKIENSNEQKACLIKELSIKSQDLLINISSSNFYYSTLIRNLLIESMINQMIIAQKILLYAEKQGFKSLISIDNPKMEEIKQYLIELDKFKEVDKSKINQEIDIKTEITNLISVQADLGKIMRKELGENS
jgi:hypothetical protein